MHSCSLNFHHLKTELFYQSYASASKITYNVSAAALNSTHSLSHMLTFRQCLISIITFRISSLL